MATAKVTVNGNTILDLTDATASASNIVSPNTAYGSTGAKLSGSITTKSATTYNTSSSDQTIASGQYLSGAQTIKAVTYSGLSASNIADGVTVQIGDSNDPDRIASVTGTLAFVTYYTGTSDPAASLGNDGDIYLKVVS